MRWAKRSKAAFGEQPGRACFGIVQGGTFAASAPALGRSAASKSALTAMRWAVWRWAKPQSAMFETLDATVPHLPADRPRYLMGVGKPADIVGAVLRGIDMFDCVLPTRSGRNGQAFTREGALNLAMRALPRMPRRWMRIARCPACRQFTRAYLHHVVKAGEIIAAMLLTWHNLTYYQDLMSDLRDAIAGGTLAEFVVSISSPAAEFDLSL